MIVPQVKYKSYDFSVDNFLVSSQFRVLHRSGKKILLGINFYNNKISQG